MPARQASQCQRRCESGVGAARLPSSKTFNHMLQPLDLLILCQQLGVVQLEDLCDTPVAVRHPPDLGQDAYRQRSMRSLRLPCLTNRWAMI